jgi:hypothetical protein
MLVPGRGDRDRSVRFDRSLGIAPGKFNWLLHTARSASPWTS